MTGYGDVGEEVIGRLAGRLACEPHQLTLWRRGLTWYPGGLTQHIWAEPADQNAVSGNWRVQMRTWCLKRVVTSSQETANALAAELPQNAIGALIRKPGSPSRFGLGVSISMGADRVEWTSRLMAALARVQLHDALRLTGSEAVLASGAVADVATDRLSEGSASVPVPPPLDADVLPPLALEVLPFSDLATALRVHDGVRAIATHSGVTASFPWTASAGPNELIVFELRIVNRRPFGDGVWASMALPISAPAHLLHAVALNEAEMGADSPTDSMGGWIVRNNALLHEVFVPWSLCAGEVLRLVVDSAARRAAWLRRGGTALVPGEWSVGTAGRVLPFRGRT
jgi:hypothetical protein